VRQIRPVEPLAGQPGPLDCVWTADASSPVMSPRILGHDVETGILTCRLKLELLAPGFDRAATAELLARILGEYPSGLGR
jgi:hypothetical protein